MFFCNYIITLIQEVLYYIISKNISFMTLFKKFIKDHAFLIFLIGKPFYPKCHSPYDIRTYSYSSSLIYHSSLIKYRM